MASAKKPRRTSEEIEAHLVKWRESGSTIRRFCSEHGIPPASFYQWLSERKLTKQTQAGKTKPLAAVRPDTSHPSRGEFREVKVTGQVSSPRGWTVHTPSGFVFVFESCALDADTLIKLIGGLR